MKLTRAAFNGSVLLIVLIGLILLITVIIQCGSRHHDVAPDSETELNDTVPAIELLERDTTYRNRTIGKKRVKKQKPPRIVPSRAPLDEVL